MVHGLAYNNHFLVQEIMGHSKLIVRRDQFLRGFTRIATRLPSCAHIDGVRKLQGLRYMNMSSQIGGKSSQNDQKNMQDSRLPSAYESAMEALSTLITQKKRNGILAIGGQSEKLDRMLRYIKILGLEEKIASLKIIHVAGTKGKGSTCAFSEAILRECGLRTGLFTSPHLIDVRERYRLDGLDICEDKFLQYFWSCWNQLKANISEDLPMPPLFQFLTVLAFQIFVSEKVDVAIIEVGLGGKVDSTNVIKAPVVCGITSLGMDHMEILGDTLGQIASQKAGILKPQVPAFTVPQLSEAMEVLEERAKELVVPLEVVPPLTLKKLNGTRLSLSGDHQLSNAALAVSLCKSWLRSTSNWKRLTENVCTSQKLFLCQAFQHIARLLLLPLLFLLISLARICHGNLTFREYGRGLFMAKMFLTRISREMPQETYHPANSCMKMFLIAVQKMDVFLVVQFSLHYH